jgi:hypothetical protein
VSRVKRELIKLVDGEGGKNGEKTRERGKRGKRGRSVGGLDLLTNKDGGRGDWDCVQSWIKSEQESRSSRAIQVGKRVDKKSSRRGVLSLAASGSIQSWIPRGGERGEEREGGRSLYPSSDHNAKRRIDVTEMRARPVTTAAQESFSHQRKGGSKY